MKKWIAFLLIFVLTAQLVPMAFASGRGFDDVVAGSWYEAAVNWAVNHSITNGMGDNKFMPDATCTRGQVVTFLWRAKGSVPPTSSINPFTDVESTAFYYMAVLWAVQKEITQGMGDGKFGPNLGCTRGQVVTFLWRTEGKPSVSGGTGSNVEPGDNELPIIPIDQNPFNDVPSGAYYYQAVLWAVEKKITNGMGNGKFMPDATCTRAQIVTFLYRDLA